MWVNVNVSIIHKQLNGDANLQEDFSSASHELPSKPKPPRTTTMYKAEGPPSLPSRPRPGHPLYFHMMQTPHGIAIHDYDAQAHDELSLKVRCILVISCTEIILAKVTKV